MHRLTNLEKQKIEELYNLGKMDSEISKELNITRSSVFHYRKSHNLKTKFTYSKISKIDYIKFEKLFNAGLSDYAIARELNMSPDGIFSHRQRYGFTRDKLIYGKSIELTELQKQVLIGTLLGDSSFRCKDGCINPSVTCAHGVKQKLYCEHKTEIFKSLGAKCSYHKRNIPDKRNGIYYEDYTMTIPANPALKDWYTQLYTPKKIIPITLVEKYFTEVSLAFMFMDDGSKTHNSYTIATNCFKRENIEEFSNFLFSKFNIETSIFKDNVLYIKSNSRNLFSHLVSKYIIPSMKYKLHTVS